MWLFSGPSRLRELQWFCSPASPESLPTGRHPNNRSPASASQGSGVSAGVHSRNNPERLATASPWFCSGVSVAQAGLKPLFVRPPPRTHTLISLGCVSHFHYDKLMLLSGVPVKSDPQEKLHINDAYRCPRTRSSHHPSPRTMLLMMKEGRNTSL